MIYFTTSAIFIMALWLIELFRHVCNRLSVCGKDVNRLARMVLMFRIQFDLYHINMYMPEYK